MKLAGGPGPTLVCALSCSTYSVLGDNPSMVPISMFNVSVPKLSITFPPYCREYCVITPLGVAGGTHCKVTDVEVAEANFSEHGSVGTENNSRVNEFDTSVASYVQYVILKCDQI